MAPRPIIYRIPFSHFCQKAEWGLTQAGIPYDTVDIPLWKMGHMRKATTTGLVPAMVVDGHLIEGSDQILQWAHGNAVPECLPLYPEGVGDAVRQWEDWAGDVVGPAARREAYRVAYNDPWRFTRSWSLRIIARLGRRVTLQVLKAYKARRFDDEDRDAVPAIFRTVSGQLQRTGTGYLLGNAPTAADIAVAALCRPFLYAQPGRDYASMQGWQDVTALVKRIKPRKTGRQRKRPVRQRDWAVLRSLSQGSTDSDSS